MGRRKVPEGKFTKGLGINDGYIKYLYINNRIPIYNHRSSRYVCSNRYDVHRYDKRGERFITAIYYPFRSIYSDVYFTSICKVYMFILLRALIRAI